MADEFMDAMEEAKRRAARCAQGCQQAIAQLMEKHGAKWQVRVDPWLDKAGNPAVSIHMSVAAAEWLFNFRDDSRHVMPPSPGRYPHQQPPPMA